jgi:hypothetical protein
VAINTQVGAIKSGAFHYGPDLGRIKQSQYTCVENYAYTFENFFHPFVDPLIGRLNQTSVGGLMDPAFLQGLETDPFDGDYPWWLARDRVQVQHEPESIDVTPSGPYANYNWELFYHMPVMIAIHLSKNQRFAEAQRWFHYVFDPTVTDTITPPPDRYWKFLGFRKQTGVRNIDELLTLLSTPDANLTPQLLQDKQVVLAGYKEIMQHPFKPHAVARTRTVAYQYYVIMKYLDNLIAWGDSLFLQYTIETTNEATLCYVLAANLLGPRPQQLPARGTIAPKNFQQLKKAGLDAMGNALVELESQFPFNMAVSSKGGNSSQNGSLFGTVQSLYFCIPPNQKLLGYWDTVADRLFKIRHCMDITGVVRPLPLFDPPIDPGMLVKAAAAGIDIGSIVSGLNQPVSPVRSMILIQKALEVCAEVRSLGNALLSVLEKGDAEQLAQLRQTHEIALQQMTQNVRFLQSKQAQEATTSLLTSRATALERLHYYQRLLGLPADPNAPDTITIDRRELTEENFDDAYSQLVGQYDKALTLQKLPNLSIAGGSSAAQQSGASGSGLLYLNTNEDAELNSHLPRARDATLIASTLNALAAGFAPVPDADVDLHYWGIGGKIKLNVGTALVAVAKIASEVSGIVASWERDQANMASKNATYERRADEWLLQYNLAAHELMQIGRQILTSLITEQVAYHEYKTASAQAVQLQEVLTFLQGDSQTTTAGASIPGKYTNLDFYTWMQGEVSRLYYQYYRFAVDTARKAEQTMKQELMRPELDATQFVQFNYWDTGRQGLLSAEALYLDLKRLEMAYHDNNKREFEITRHVSLRQLDPLALLSLKITGSCTVSIPEWLYDRDCPGHYMRRIKTVALSVPCVVGPYTSLNCMLTLQKSSVRAKPTLNSGTYARNSSSDDDRFADYYGSVESVVTSGAASDTGMFETNLRDERFLPFEGAGAVSTWSLSLPTAYPPFDYMTISDAILHIRYTARDGGGQLASHAVKEFKQLFQPSSVLANLFSLRYDFPSEWATFTSAGGNFVFQMRRDHFPYAVQSAMLTVDQLVMYAQSGQTMVQQTVSDSQDASWTNLSNDLNKNIAHKLSLPSGTALTTDPEAQVFLIVQYHLG